MTDTGALFSADPEHVRWFGERVLRVVQASSPRRVLDIGCGDGSLLVYLARALPQASLVGVDLSATNIAAAHALIAGSSASARIDVQEGDYLRFDAGRFDLLVASSSLQGITAPREELAEKIARDTAPGGILAHVTPTHCGYNAALNSVRKVLRWTRSPATDALVLGAARLLHSHQPVDKLRERVSYMYLILRHSEDHLRAALQRRGFQLVATETAPHTSLGQPKHRFAAMRGSEQRELVDPVGRTLSGPAGRPPG